VKKLRWAIILLAPALAAAAVLIWVTSEPDAGPHNVLTPQEAADGWTLLFDGETTNGWTIDGPAAVRDGLLVLGGDQPTVATSAKPYDAIELQLDYRFEAGQEGLLETKMNGSGSAYGLGYLTPKPHAWNRVTYRRQGGRSSLDCKPLAKPLFQFVSTRPVLGTGDDGAVHIAFRLNFPGSHLALRNIKLKPPGNPPNPAPRGA
jgi:hypothetical protein